MVIYIKTTINKMKCPNCGEYVELKTSKSKMIDTIVISLLIVLGIILAPIIGWGSVAILLLGSILCFKVLLLISTLIYKSALPISPEIQCKKCGAVIKLSKEEYEEIEDRLEEE